jgi:hypothetical protein
MAPLNVGTFLESHDQVLFLDFRIEKFPIPKAITRNQAFFLDPIFPSPPSISEQIFHLSPAEQNTQSNHHMFTCHGRQ